MKTSWRRLLSSSSENVFKTSSRWLDQEEYIRLSHSSSEVVLVKTNIFVLAICFQEFLLRCLPDVLKTSSRHLQDVLERCLQDVFKTYYKVKLFLLTSLRVVFDMFLRHTVKTVISRSDFWENYGQCTKFARVKKVLVFPFPTPFSGCLQRRI